jgi:diguanylate cyclase (GGDEF)-like protein/PAS domain S-box-containing protein
MTPSPSPSPADSSAIIASSSGTRLNPPGAGVETQESDIHHELASVKGMMVGADALHEGHDTADSISIAEENQRLKTEIQNLQRQLMLQSSSDVPATSTQIHEQSNSFGLATDLNRQLIDSIFKQSSDAMILIRDHHCVAANEVATSLLDCSAETLQGRSFYWLLIEIFNIDDQDWYESMLQQLASEDEVVREVCRETPAGELWIELRFRTLESEGESAVLVSGHDISRLRKFQKELVRSHDFLHHTINSVQQPLSVKSADLRYVLANDAFCELLDMPFDQIHGRTYSELVSTEATYSKQLDEQILETGEATVNVEWLRRSNGSVTTLSTFRSRFYDPVTGAAFIVTASRDVTVELATQRRLRLLASVFENAHESVAILGKDGTLHEANPEFIGTVGVLRKQLIGCSVEEFVDWETADFADIVRLVTTGTPWSGHVKLLKADHDPVSCWLSLSPSRSQGGEITNMIAMFSDITQIESTRCELHRQALHDNLTSLPNRRFYRQRINELIDSDTEKKLRFGVSFLDLDDFKLVNDSLGHDAGDQLLIEVSQRIQSQLGDDCFIARFGGDEFALLLPEVPGTKSRAQEYSALVVNALCEPFQLGEHEVNVGASVGTTLYPDDATDVESLMRQADVAMYRAKEEGKNKVRLFSPELVEVIERRQTMLSDLRRAVEHNELHVVYQPKLSLETGMVVGCEALLRWRKPDGTSVSPDQFIPLADESGLINRLGDQMFECVCQQARLWNEMGLLCGPVAVNLTERQLREPRLLERFIHAIELHELQPEWLELEITENAIMKDLDRAIILMNRVREYGIRIAIDDFGTGYSSLGYIKDFPVQCLKLDNLFVDGLPDDQDAVAVAKTVLSLAEGLGLDVIAEGVETEAQRDFLTSMGCEMAQGYLISAPMEAEEYQQWLIESFGQLEMR